MKYSISMEKVKSFAKDIPTFITSQKFAAVLGVGIAVFQLAAAVEAFRTASSKRKQIGFDPKM